MLGGPVSVRKFHGVITMTIKSLTLSLCIAVTALAASPAIAQVAPEAAPEAATAAVVVKKNKPLLDATGRRLGKIFEVNSEKGYATFLPQMKNYRVPPNTNSSGHASRTFRS